MGYTTATLTLAVSGSGSTSPAAGSYACEQGSTVSISATAASGWQFSSWTGNVSTVANTSASSTTVTMNGDYTITANFTETTPAPAPPADEGGGGGGGGGSVGGLTGLMGIMGETGRFCDSIMAESRDKLINVYICQGTYGWNRMGSLLSAIIIQEIATTDPLPQHVREASKIYSVGPDGAYFEPPITMTFKYDEADLPTGASEHNLYIATYNGTADAWDRLGGTVDPETNQITLEIGHFSLYRILVNTSPADLVMTDLVIEPAEVYVGDNVTISATVTNNGDLTGDEDVSLMIDGTVAATQNVTVPGSGSVTVSFQLTGDASGLYQVALGDLLGSFEVMALPAAFTYSGLTLTPKEVMAGQTVAIGLVVTNTSGYDGDCDVTLKLNDVVTETRSVAVAANASQSLVFSTRFDTAGTYALDINGLEAVLVVEDKILELPPKGQRIEPTALPGVDTKTPALTTTAPASTGDTTAKTQFGWWLYLIIGVVVVMAGLLIYRIRKRQY